MINHHDAHDGAHSSSRPLNLAVVPLMLRAQAHKAFEARDALGFVMSAGDNTKELALVSDNLWPLTDAGIYERALSEALTSTRTNHHHWTLDVLGFLVRQADRERLRAAGEPLPGSGPFRLFRGVAGARRHRHVRGLHWTSRASTAAWFAKRVPFLEDPAVYVIDVPASAVLSYSNARNEDDFLVILPRTVRPVRLPELPDAVAPRRGHAL